MTPTLQELSATRGTLTQTGRKCGVEAAAGTKAASGTEGCDFGNVALLSGGS